MANYLTPWRRGSLTGGPVGGGLFGQSPLFDLHRQVNRVFEDLFDRGGEGGLSVGLTTPALDLHQDDKQLEITAELPGVKEEDIDLTIEDGVLILAGEKKSERRDEDGYSERSYGRFERRITLPTDVDEDNCSADFRDGVLRITFPRTEAKSRGRRIPLGGQRQRASLEAQNDADSAPRQQAAAESDRGKREDNQQA